MTTLPVPNLISRSPLRYGFFLIALVASMALSAHAQNLVTNPGFETGDFTGWTPVGSGVGTFNVHSGNYSAALCCHCVMLFYCGGNIDQTITTVAGQLYHVDFWLSNIYGDSSFPNAFGASFAGVTILSLNDSANFGYTHFSGNVRATSTSSDLRLGGSHRHVF